MAKLVSVVLPTFNEKENIDSFIKEVFDQEKDLPSGYKIEVVVADSHSPDGTGEIVKKIVAKNHKVHLIEVGRGLGVGIVEGHRYAMSHLKPDILAQMDADGQVGADVLVRLVNAIEDGYTLALGSRFVPGGKNLLPLSRRIYSLGSSWFVRIVMGL